MINARGDAPFQADPAQFRPALARLEETPAPPLGRAALWLCLGFVGVVLVGSMVGRIDIVAVADGKLVPSTYLKIVQPADSGVVKDLLVKEGQEVAKDQVLIRMDALVSESDLKSIGADYWSRRLGLRRIDAELRGASLLREAEEPPESFAKAVAQMSANREAQAALLAQEEAALTKARHDLDTAVEVRSRLQQTLPHYREQEAAYEKLSRDGFAGRIMYTDKQRERIEKEQELRAQESAILAARAVILQSERRMRQLHIDYRRRLEAERAELAPGMEKAAQDLTKQRHRHSYLELRAPQDGIVKDLSTHTAGTVVSPGTILMTLVPKNEVLRAEVWVRNDDVGFVRQGQAAKLKFGAFAFQKYGMATGAVAQVSADAAEEANDAAGGGRGKSASPLAYKTQIDLGSQVLDTQVGAHRLKPGMQVSAEIHLGTRTVMEYLLAPVSKAFHEAVRER